MSQNPQKTRDEIRAQMQERIKKQREFRQMLIKSGFNVPPQPYFPNESRPQITQEPLKSQTTEEIVGKILQDLDVDRPLRTWSSQITSENIDHFYNMINKLNVTLYPKVCQKFVQNPLRINPYSLTREQLLEKNDAIINSRKGTFLFGDLIGSYYWKALPEDFINLYKEHSKFDQSIFSGFFGNWIFAGVFIKMRKNKDFSRLSQIKYIWSKTLLLFMASFFAMNKYFEFSDRKFANQNVEIVETCVDKHLKLFEAHNINLDETFKRQIV